MESAWNDADTLIIPSIEGSGINVVLKALSDDMYIYIFAAWNDSVMDNTRKGWSYNGTHWDNVGGNEDRIEFAWSLGADIVCGHNPATADSMLFDVWHWKASRTAVGGWADDKYWDGTGRHSDAKSAGGYSDNSVVAQAENSSVITTALGNSTNVAAFSDDDRPFWDNSGVEITWTAGVNATPVSDFVNGYKTVVPTGSRGDVLAESVSSELWILEILTMMWHFLLVAQYRFTLLSTITLEMTITIELVELHRAHSSLAFHLSVQQQLQQSQQRPRHLHRPLQPVWIKLC
jgi:hypothetical protein